MSVLVLGGGSTGEHFVGALRRLDPDVPITLVERELVGGECTYYACMPSKTLLRSPKLVRAAGIAPGAAQAVTGSLDVEEVFAWRDWVTSDWSDQSQVEWLADHDAELVRGEARVTGSGRLQAAGRELEYEKLVIATGSVPAVPPIPGLDEVEHWGSREGTSTHEVPKSLVVLGGGAVGCELAQLFRRLGSEVTIVQSRRLLPRVDEAAGALVKDAFEAEGIEVVLDARAESVEAGGPGVRVHLEGGGTREAEKLLVATGRRPNVEGLGLETIGIEPGKQGVDVDDHCAAGPNVWAIGDVTGVALFTHVGKYQARVAAANAAGGDARADYRAIPSSVFTDPEVASVGTTEGEGLVTAQWDMKAVPRSATYEKPKRPGLLKIAADPKRGVLVGAVAVAPEAGEWLQQLTLAIRAEVPIEVLRDTIQPFPTFSEAVFFAVRELPL